MGIFRKLFGGKKPYKDTTGIYFYAKCDNCGTIVRVRADRQYDLNRVEGGLEWRKTIVDSKCFRRMYATVKLNDSYQMEDGTLTGGTFVTEAEWQAQEAAKQG